MLSKGRRAYQTGCRWSRRCRGLSFEIGGPGGPGYRVYLTWRGSMVKRRAFANVLVEYFPAPSLQMP